MEKDGFTPLTYTAENNTNPEVIMKFMISYKNSRGRNLEKVVEILKETI